MEKDNEINVNSGDYDFGARIYDSRLGRWLSLDPLMGDFPYESNYVFVSNSPLIYIDKTGETKYFIQNIYNEATGETSQNTIVIDDDLKKGTVRRDRSNSNDYYDNIGWFDINLVQNITVKKDGTQIKGPVTTETGELRYENNPLFDLFGFRDSKEKVNSHLNDKKDSKQKDWGGINWTWSGGQGGESRTGSGNIEIINIDLFMDVLTSMSPNSLNIPDELVKNNSTLEVINVLMQTIDRQSGAIDNSTKALENLADKINNWKDKNTVDKCHHGSTYNRDGSLHSASGEVPKGKTVSKDRVDCSKKDEK
jgi:RHS repeat-associated protein